MSLYVGLDVSQKETEICIVDEEGRRTWRGRCPTRPESIAQVLQRHAPEPTRVGMETGPLAIWLWHSLRALDVPVDCLHARHVAAALSLQVNKTDANDAHGIAQVVRSGWYRPVAVKSLQSCRVRAVLSARHQLVTMRTRSLQPDPRHLRPSAWCSHPAREQPSKPQSSPAAPQIHWFAPPLLRCWQHGGWQASARGRWSSSWFAWLEVATRAGGW